MTPQTTITITVPPEIAKAYSHATETERQQIAHKIAFFLKTTDPDKPTFKNFIKQWMSSDNEQPKEA